MTDLKWWIGVAAAAFVVAVACNGDDDGGTDSGAPPAEELVFEDFGAQTVEDTGGYVDIDVTIPEGAVSTSAWCGGYGDGALGAVWQLTDPGGATVYTGDAPDAGGFRSDFLDDLVPGLLPVSPDVGPTAGTWHFQWFIGGGNDGSVDCGAVHRVDSLSDPATIHIEFVFVSVPGLDATTAPDDPNWQAALAELEAAWGNGKVEPTYAYVPFGGDVGTYGVVDVTDTDYSEFNDLLRTSAPAGERTITFFLVEEISSDGATILGLAGGPPGAAAVHGTSKSGVIVTTADLASAPADVGKIMAHEGGHFLGLFHTTEKDGARFDPLGDTEECPPANDADGNGTMNTAECGGLGAENLMWWTLTAAPGEVSGDQSLVLRSNPVAD